MADIVFIADRHFDARPGRAQAEALDQHYDLVFAEDDWRLLSEQGLDGCRLLALNMIAGTTGTTPPGRSAEAAVRAYLERGGSLLLLHGGSAAFWHWDWWRDVVGLRWVRGSDPDGAEPSWHPVRPYRIEPAKSRHPLSARLRAIDLPDDEIYLGLEQTAPVWTLMQTTVAEGTFPQCWAARTPWSGDVLGFLPGHRREVACHAGVIENLRVLVDSVLGAAHDD